MKPANHLSLIINHSYLTFYHSLIKISLESIGESKRIPIFAVLFVDTLFE